MRIFTRACLHLPFSQLLDWCRARKLIAMDELKARDLHLAACRRALLQTRPRLRKASIVCGVWPLCSVSSLIKGDLADIVQAVLDAPMATVLGEQAPGASLARMLG